MSEIEPDRKPPPFEGNGKDKRTMLDRFIERIKESIFYFQNKSEQQGKLWGRIYDLQKTASEVLDQLKKIKEELRHQVDKDLFSIVESVVNPMIRDVNRLQKSVENHNGTVSQQATAFKKYSEWIDKAKLWVQVCSKNSDKETITKAIVKLTINEFLEVIDRDLQVIEDYMDHMIDNLELDAQEKLYLIEKLQRKIDPYIKNLKALKVFSDDIALRQISKWKAKVDKHREKYFDGALHTIDKVIHEMNPASASEEQHEHLVEILTHLAYLEEEIPQIHQEIETIDLSDDFQHKMMEVRIAALQKELHHLNLDLRLTPELIDRIQTLQHLIDKIKLNP